MRRRELEVELLRLATTFAEGQQETNRLLREVTVGLTELRHDVGDLRADVNALMTVLRDHITNHPGSTQG
jgi:hypothetical protein